MNKLEVKITAILVEIAPHVRLMEQAYEKWVILDDSRQDAKGRGQEFHLTEE